VILAVVISFYARQQNASRVLVMARASVCPSVCLSVTPLYCAKTVQARITKSLLWAAPRTLVYRDKILCPYVRRFPLKEGIKKGYPLKRRYFAVIGPSSVKMVADRYKHVAYHNKHCSRAFLVLSTSMTLNYFIPSKL